LFLRWSGFDCATIAPFCGIIELIIGGKAVLSVVYTIDEIRKRIEPVALKYRLPAVYLFGSYARGDATDTSDVDILVDRTGTDIKGMFAMGGLYNDLSDAVGKTIDLVTTGALEQESTRERTPWFVENLERERVKIFG
jgi:predicted nucleotidyltransferase